MNLNSPNLTDCAMNWTPNLLNPNDLTTNSGFPNSPLLNNTAIHPELTAILAEINNNNELDEIEPTGSGIRLVQRKFAQGVPVPTSHIAPLPPERQADSAKEEPKTVYHSRMSARNLLDIVSMQNVHKQPMVLLERLRVNDIPTPSSPTLMKKKLNTKAKNNNMCLRPREKKTQKYLRKRKKEVTKEGPIKKRPLLKRDEMSSATDDDTPLLYLRKNSPRQQPGSNGSVPSVSGTTNGSITPAQARRSSRRSPSVAGSDPPSRRALRPRLLSDKRKMKRLRPYPATRSRAAVTQPPEVVATPKVQAQPDPPRDPSPEPPRDPPPEPPRDPSPESCPSTAYKSVHEVVLAATSRSPKLVARCRKCRDCGIVGKVLKLKDLVRPGGVNPGAIHDLNTELEEAMCPSLSTLRSRRRLSRAAGEHIYLDILPPDTPHILQILCKTTDDKRTVSAVRVVDRDVAVNAEHPTLEEHENLLDQLLACMSRRAQQTNDDEAETQSEPKPAKLLKKKNTAVKRVRIKVPKTNGVQDEAITEPTSVPLPRSSKPADVPPEPLPGPSEAQTASNAVFKAPKVPIAPEAPAAPLIDDDMESVIGRSAPAGTVVDAPVFHPTAAEFTDPIEYYKKIRPYASKYGLCKIVPPAGFSAPCVLDDHIRFAVIYQYISKLYNRWGPVARELAAIKVLLRTQKVVFTRAPLLNGCEVNLPKLYHAVERHGGLTKVIHRKRWGRVAEDMKLASLQRPERKLDKIYMKFLLPYATLSDKERQSIMTKVEKYWTTTKYKKMLARARNPLHAQDRLLGASDSSSDEGEGDTAGALEEAEDCITQGRVMNLMTFRKVAKSFMEAQFPAGRPDTAEVERAYWRAILLGTDHIVANTASIDTGEEGHGFPKDPDAPCGTHPWNLKMLASNPGNVLRFLGPALGVTVPTLHLSMLYSTCCWHRDPHGLPWVEFLHTGPNKIWYGIPSSQSNNFRRAVETLCPAYCQNKSIWLASDIAMIPPEILSEHGVALSRVEQEPGEFVMVFPEAHSCSVTTGFSVSESVYFAPNSWLDTVQKLFQELRSSCEPTMFSLEQLLLNGAERVGGAAARLLAALLRAELRHRAELEARGVQVVVKAPSAEQQEAWNTRGADECEYCRASLYLSKVVGVTERRTPLCPEHAILLLSRCRITAELELRSAHSTAALQALMARLPRGSGDA